MDATTTSTSSSSRPAPAPKAKQRQQKNLSRYLHRATTFAVPSLPFSPSSSRDPTSRASFSGAAPLLFPAVSRQGSVAREPTSPIVSCIGQVKRKGKKKKQQKEPKEKSATGGGSVLARLFGRRKPPANAPAPAVEGRRRSTKIETLQGPDPWKAGRVVILQPITWPSKKPADSATVTTAISTDSAAEHVDSADSAAESAGGDAVLQPVTTTAPADSEPDLADSAGSVEETKEKKEVNLWKRRAIRPLRPLVVGVGPSPSDGLRTV